MYTIPQFRGPHEIYKRGPGWNYGVCAEGAAKAAAEENVKQQQAMAAKVTAAKAAEATAKEEEAAAAKAKAVSAYSLWSA